MFAQRLRLPHAVVWGARGVLVVLLGVAAVRGLDGSPRAQTIGDLTVLTASTVAALACWRAGSRVGALNARGWRLLAVAVAVWVTGQAVWTTYGFALNHAYPFPSAADIGFIGYSVPAAAALLSFRRTDDERKARPRALIDGLLVGAALLFVSWVIALGPASRAGASGLAAFTGLAYPIADGLLAMLVLVVAMGRHGGHGLSWVLLSGGLLTLTATDSVYVSLTLQGRVGLTGTVLVAGWVTAFLLIAAAAIASQRPSTPRPPGRSITVGRQLLPCLPVVVAVVMAARADVFRDPLLRWVGLAVLVLFTVRQVVITSEQVSLANRLESRVAQRTFELRQAQDDLQQSFDNAPTGIAWADMDGVLVKVNAAFCALVGRRCDQLIGRTVTSITVPEDVAATEALFVQVAQGRSDFPPRQQRYRHPDGHDVWAEVNVLVTTDDAGAPRYVVAQVQDITGRQEAARALARQAAFLDAVLENLDSGIVACDARGRVTLFNQASRNLHGLPAAPTIEPGNLGRHYHLYRPDGITPLPERDIPLLRALRGDAVRDAEIVIAPPGLNPRVLLVNGHGINDEDGNLLGAVVAMHDITDYRHAEAALTRQALHDPLTDLPNRVLLRDRLEHAISCQARRPTPLALLLLDLDDFKLVNDSFGHQTGDEVLKDVATRLRTCLQAQDTVARLGGDEFAILLEDTTETQALAIAGRILAVLREPMHVEGRMITTDVSIGVVSCSGGGTAETLLRDADLAMYAAKENGKGNVRAFEAAQHRSVLERVTLDADLRTALDAEQFTLVYQPIVSLLSGDLQGFEALIRWDHPERGVVMPAAFIPAAEANALIVPLGQWALREACRQARAWIRTHADTAGLTMSVNLSVRQLQDPNILDTVAAALADAGLPPGNLLLEITESVLGQHAQIVATLEHLRAMGVHLVLDDFGTGYSSLSRLHALPIEKIKIDKSFVDLIAGGKAPMVAATIAMAHGLGLQTVAEGVETEEQLSFLRLHGCDEVQGYLFGRPQTAAVAGTLLQRRGRRALWPGRDGIPTARRGS